MSERGFGRWPGQGPACAVFDESVAELALGVVDPDERDELVAHAATCGRCQAELEVLSSISDRLLALAPEAEPPVGFDTRVLEAVPHETARHEADPLAPVRLEGSPIAGTRERPRRRRVRILAAVAGVLVLAAMLALGASRLGSDDTRLEALDRVDVSSVRSAALLDGRGTTHGSVLITTGAQRTLTMSLSGLDRGEYRCSVRHDDGSLHEIATWYVAGAGSGTWAVPIGVADAATSRVVVSEPDGSVVASGEMR